MPRTHYAEFIYSVLLLFACKRKRLHALSTCFFSCKIKTRAETHCGTKHACLLHLLTKHSMYMLPDASLVTCN